MPKTTRQVLIYLFSIIPICIVSPQIEIADYTDFNSLAIEVEHIRHKDPANFIRLYNEAHVYFLEHEDTLSAIKTLVELAATYGHQAHYQLAYDNLWEALLLADLAQNDEGKVLAYIQLGRYYSFYKREEESLKYLQEALKLCKELVQQNILRPSDLVKCYYVIGSTYQELNQISKARNYLDSCRIYQNLDFDTINYHYIRFQSAICDNIEGKHQTSLDSLYTILPWFEKNVPSVLVLLFTQIGNASFGLGNHQVAEQYYQRALGISEVYNSHLDFTPIIYEQLANLYMLNEENDKANDVLLKEKKLNARFFDSRSENNRSLLEIKDEFRVEKEKQNQLIQEQRIAKLEHEERVNLLENIILLAIIGFILFAGIFFFNNIRRKHKIEKQLIRQKRELEIKQANELLELKNKELATSSLKLIEKDEILAALKDKLSQGNGDLKAPELRKLVRTISHSNAQNWEEFETRFMSVNKTFYEKLNANFPKLSRGDQKLCALVKLNLSSKEMAKLLGISIESVHTNRYRLRKKLGLSRETSLTEFVATL